MFTLVKFLLLAALAVTVFYVVAPARGRQWLQERYELVRPVALCAWRVLCGAARGARDEFNKQKGE